MESGINRLLVVDSDPTDVECAARAAARADYSFAAAASAKELPTLVDAFRPTLLLLDLDAGGDVEECLRLLAARDRQGQLLLASTSEHALAVAAARARACGLTVQGTVPKPFAELDLAARLAAARPAGRAINAAELARGLAARELVPFFQPQARNAEHGGWVVDAVEALVRWPHPRLGLVMPDEFVPLAERVDLIGPLTEQVIGASLRQLEQWNAEGLKLRCAVNLPPCLVTDPALPDRLARLLDVHGLDAPQLELEVTETATMRAPTAALDVLTRAHALGIGVSLDDFGIGYSSLTRLHELPFDEMKIDKSLVANLPHSRAASTLVGSLIELGHNLGLEVCAEGVESRAALDLLEALRCDRCQGYFLSRAVPAADIPDLVARCNSGGATEEPLPRTARAAN